MGVGNLVGVGPGDLVGVGVGVHVGEGVLAGVGVGVGEGEGEGVGVGQSCFWHCALHWLCRWQLTGIFCLSSAEQVTPGMSFTLLVPACSSMRLRPSRHEQDLLGIRNCQMNAAQGHCCLGKNSITQTNG